MYIALSIGEDLREPLNDPDTVCCFLRSLSPKFMKWDDTTWLVDLGPTLNYWYAKLSIRDTETFDVAMSSFLRKAFFFYLEEIRKGMEIDAGFKSDVNRSGVREPSSEATSNALAAESLYGSSKESRMKSFLTSLDCDWPWVFVLAEGPWDALFCLEAIRESHTGGLWRSNSTRARTTVLGSRWEVFERICSVYAKSFHVGTRKASSYQEFKKGMRTFRLAVERLHTPFLRDLIGADELQVSRRFGQVVGSLWEWTCSFLHECNLKQRKEERLEDQILNFSWQSFEERRTLQVGRHLDFSANSWQEVQEFLREDLSNLSRLDGWNHEDKVVSLEWSVITSDHLVCPIPICFRIPHHLRGEDPQHNTTLRQAQHIFDHLDYYLSDYFPKLSISFDSYDEEESVLDPMDGDTSRGVIGWKLRVDERIYIPPFMVSLFADGACNASVESVVNRTQIPVHGFTYIDDVLPEHSSESVLPKSSAEVSFEKHTKKLADKNHRDNFVFKTSDFTTDIKRPLFLFSKIQQSSFPEGRLIFVERVAERWWREKDSGYRRDYYVHITEDGRKFWVFKDNLDRWYRHGVYS